MDIKKLIIASCLVMIAVVGYIYIRDQEHIPPHSQHKINRYLRQDMRNFCYQSFMGSNQLVSIQADRFTVEKKRLGFFRISLINQARMDNALIEIFSYPSQIHQSHKQDNNLPSRGSSKQKSGAEEEIKLSFKDYLSPLLKKKKIISVIISPVTIKLYKGKQAIFSISAKRCVANLLRHNIKFKGHVKAIYGARVLKAHHVELDTKARVLKVDSPFTLTENKKTIRGRYLLTDLKLLPLSRPQER
ncbi:MAG: hypothetical protein DRG39_05350 [Deltaproteobacteria bacterium]|nr:MAG: hypothetical protein DRG39_05350 [Deltaproteobacteria bacterium]